MAVSEERFLSTIFWMSLSPQNSCWNPNAKVMILGGRKFGKWLGHEGGAHRIGVEFLWETLQNSLALSRMWGHSKKVLATNQEEGRGLSPEWYHAGTLILGLLASKTVRNKFLLYISCLVCGILLKLSKWTKTGWFKLDYWSNGKEPISQNIKLSRA